MNALLHDMFLGVFFILGVLAIKMLWYYFFVEDNG